VFADLMTRNWCNQNVIKVVGTDKVTELVTDQ